jgi:hypothetical protein
MRTWTTGWGSDQDHAGRSKVGWVSRSSRSQPRFLKVHDSILPLDFAIIHLLSPRLRTSGSEEIRKIITFRFRLSVLFATRQHSRQSPPLFFSVWMLCAHGQFPIFYAFSLLLSLLLLLLLLLLLAI